MPRDREDKMPSQDEMNPNPVNRPGSRNPFCPNYPFCLDVAVANWWPRFSCDQCEHRNLDCRPDIEEFSYETVGWDEIWSEG